MNNWILVAYKMNNKYKSKLLDITIDYLNLTKLLMLISL